MIIDLSTEIKFARLFLLITVKLISATNVALTMPPFEMRYRAEIHNVLPTMGMSQVFKRGEADLSGMVTDPKERLNIDQIIHETKVFTSRYLICDAGKLYNIATFSRSHGSSI